MILEENHCYTIEFGSEPYSTLGKFENNLFSSASVPPKNGVIALWKNKRVVKCKYYVSQKQNGPNNKSNFFSILLTLAFKFDKAFNRLKYYYSVISLIVPSP